MHWPNHGEPIAQPPREPAPDHGDDADGGDDKGGLLLGHPRGFEEETSEGQGRPWQASETPLDHQDEESGSAGQESPERLELRKDSVLAFADNVLYCDRRRPHFEINHRGEGHDRYAREDERHLPTPDTTASACWGIHIAVAVILRLSATLQPKWAGR